MLWPVRAARALARRAPLPGFARVVLVRDPTDLVAVPVVALAWLTGRSVTVWGESGDAIKYP
ncbi:MAG: hypothetical protein KIS78_02320 [Labilithrix sp.]|nr:hypothetical protein [Labilithrix sp.]